MASSFQFGDYVLDATNGINVNVVREKSPAELSLGLIQPARSIGVSVVSLTPKSKVIEIEGTLTNRGESQQTFQSDLRDLNAVFMKKADFQIGTVDGIFVYENCVVLNPENIFRNESHWNLDFIPFRIELLAPHGRAISTELTTNAYSNISSSPYTSDVSIGGSVASEPLITLTLDSTGGNAISSLTFLNRDTNESISIATNYASDDVVLVDTKKKFVTYNTRAKRFSGLLPRFKLGTNRFKVDIEAADTIAVSQESSDNSRSVYGNNQLSQQINPDANISVSQIDLLIKKIDQTLLDTYDDFNDNSLDTDRWTTSGTVNETDQQLKLKGNTDATEHTTTVDTNDKTGVTPVGEPIVGARWRQSHEEIQIGSEGGDFYAEITDGTNYIRVVNKVAGGMQLELGGTYGSGVVAQWSQDGGIIDIREVGSDIQINFNGNLKYTINDTSIAGNSYFGAKAATTNAEEGADHRLRLDNVQFYNLTNANEDITVDIQTDSGGEPSGSSVASGTATIKAKDLSTEAFTIIPVTFSTAPSLSSGTDYHVVLSQSGGDVNNYYSVKINTAGGYAQGNIETSSDGGTTWLEKAGEDMWIRVYDSFPTGFNLDLDIDYNITHHSAV